jgi:phenylpyruvate tautomerase PptA (4-oxalocrotonate tautomerase family)
MPMYFSVTQEGTLSAEARAHVAREVTRIHTTATCAPTKWVHVIFQTYPAGFGFSDGVAGSAATLIGYLRSGRTGELKTKLVQDLWPMYPEAKGLTDADIVVALQDVPPSQAMEMGFVLPEAGHNVEP